MTPAELASEVEAMDRFGSRAADRALIAAALRLAEVLATKEAEILKDPFAVFDRGPFGEKVIHALADHRSARERLASNAP